MSYQNGGLESICHLFTITTCNRGGNQVDAWPHPLSMAAWRGVFAGRQWCRISLRRKQLSAGGRHLSRHIGQPTLIYSHPELLEENESEVRQSVSELQGNIVNRYDSVVFPGMKKNEFADRRTVAHVVEEIWENSSQYLLGSNIFCF